MNIFTHLNKPLEQNNHIASSLDEVKRNEEINTPAILDSTTLHQGYYYFG